MLDRCLAAPLEFRCEPPTADRIAPVGDVLRELLAAYGLEDGEFREGGREARRSAAPEFERQRPEMDRRCPGEERRRERDGAAVRRPRIISARA